jgi:hypothetical protein
VAGAAATALLSVLGRLAATLRLAAGAPGERGAPPPGRPPSDPSAPIPVLQWPRGAAPEATRVGHEAGVAGEVVHFTYGGLWGTVYGLVQSSYGLPPVPSGLLFGLGVWLIGPAWLVPAMRLMASPGKESPLRLAVMVAGHLIYGLAVATAYQTLAPRRRGPAGCPGAGARGA